MATLRTHGQLILRDENFGIHQKNLVVDKKSKSSKSLSKNGGNGFGPRKALNDITNKSSVRPEQSSKKAETSKKKQFNIAEEMFLHDHKKCIEAQQKAMEPRFWDIVLPGHDSKVEILDQNLLRKTDPDSPHFYPEPVELDISEFDDCPTRSISPPSSPLPTPSPPWSLFAWESEPVEFLLRDEHC